MTKIQYDISIHAAACSFWHNRALILSLTRREIAGRYRGSFLGLLWSIFNPVFMLLVYTIVFGNILKARWSTVGGSQAEFSLILFVGLMIFNLFADCINRAPVLVVANTNYVKKVVFPLEILALVCVCAALFNMIISFFVWLVFYCVAIGVPSPSVLLFPLVVMPLLLLTTGCIWILMSLGVYLKDVTQVVPIITSTMMFLSPIFYPLSALPQKYWFWLYLNPITFVVEQARAVLFWGKQPEYMQMLFYTLFSLGIAWLGFAWFQKTRKGFADVL